MDGCGCHKATSFQKEPAANKPQGFLNQGPDWQPIGCKSHTKKATNWKFCYAFIGNLCSFLARWQDFIVVAMPGMDYWSFWRIDGRGSRLLLWVVLNNKLQRKCICVREQEREKKGEKKMKRETLFLIDGAFKIGANYYVKHDLNKWIWLLWLFNAGKSDRNTLQSIKRHNCPKKGRKSGDIESPVFFSEVSCYHLNSMITNLLHVPARIC